MGTLGYSKVGVRALSYSKASSLNSCPRKFQLENQFSLNTEKRTSVTFSFGHAVGMAIQATAEGESFDRMLLRVFLEWDLPLDEMGTLSEQRGRKNLWFALDAAERWWKLVHDDKMSDLKGWDIAMIPNPEGGDDIPGVELTFSIDCGEGFIYDGHLDLLVVNKERTKLKVVEVKTSNSNQIHPAMYKNSLQAVGYSVVIDKAAALMGMKGTYEVQYIVYQTGKQEFKSLPFVKSAAHRAIFLSNLVSDINNVIAYEEQDYFPHNGASCYDFFRECKYFDVCHLDDSMIERMAHKEKMTGASQTFEAVENFATFKFTLDELLDSQREQLIDVQEI